MKKKLLCGVAVFAVYQAYCDSTAMSVDHALTSHAGNRDSLEAFEDNSDFAYQFRLSGYHVRENEEFLGHKNTTNLRLTPKMLIRNLIFETDVTFGKTSQSVAPARGDLLNALKSQGAYTENSGYSKAKKKNTNYDTPALEKFKDNTSEKARLYRSFTRVTYENEPRNFKVIVGDSPGLVTFGNMQGQSGAGVSFVRSSGMFNKRGEAVLNSQSTITILRPSLVEICQDGCTIQGTVLSPGDYSLADLAPEVNLHDISIVITDDFQHKYEYKVDGNADKNPLHDGEDEFEVRFFVPQKFDPLDPYLRKYSTTVVGSGVYRYGYTKDITLNFNTQAFSGGIKAETGYSYATKYGLLFQSIGASFANDLHRRNAMSAQLFYKTPVLPVGQLTVCFNIVGKGYIDLGATANKNDIYEKIYSLFRLNGDSDYVSPFGESTKKSLSVKYVPFKIAENVGWSFLYKQSWLDHYSRSSYDISLTWRIKDKYKFVSGIGITFDNDGREYANKDILKKIDLQRRFYLGLDVPVGDQISLTSSYDYDDDRALYNKIDYKPASIKGLKITMDSRLYNGCGEYRAHGAKVKYQCKYGDFRIDHNIKMRHKPGIHVNRERLYLNTYVKNNKFVKGQNESFIIQTTKADMIDRK